MILSEWPGPTHEPRRDWQILPAQIERYFLIHTGILMSRLRITDIATLLAVAAVFLYFFRSIPSPQPFVHDESDYMNAGSRGLLDNILGAC